MKHIKYLLLFFLLLPAAAQAQFLFKDITVQAKIDMQAAAVGDIGGGVIISDFNGDGWDDIYMAGGLDSDKLFINMHDGTFRDIGDTNWKSRKPFMISDIPDTNFSYHGGTRSYPRGGSAFDYNNDGLTDLYLACEQRDILWKNNGDGTFTDVTRVAQLNFPIDQNRNNSSTFGDFNGDGYNDLFVARWVDEQSFVKDSAENTIGYAHKGFPDWLYVNNGNGTFTDRAREFGVDGDTACGNVALFFDYDRDGDLDLLVGNDFGVEEIPNHVWKNMLMETGEAKFVDVTKEIGLDAHLFSMGIGPLDYNRDGNFDFYETSIGPDSLFRNNGDGTFTNVSSSMLPANNGYERHGSYYTTTWTALMADYDNDGWEDGFIIHGNEGGIPPWISNPNQHDTSVFLRNIGGTLFQDFTDQAMSGKFIDQVARGAGYLDFNNDGKLDICLGALGKGLGWRTLDFRLLQNITPDNEHPAHWLEMRFTAKRTAKEAIGTIVDVYSGGIRHSRQVSTGGGFGSQNSLMQHVGLGEYTMADSIVVYWPCDKHRNRTINRYYNVAADQMVHYTEDTTAISHSTVSSTGPMKQMRVYPSPAQNILKVENLGASGIKRFEIYDLLGIRHRDVTCSERAFSISVGSLKPGCYILRVTADGNVVTKQFIKE